MEARPAFWGSRWRRSEGALCLCVLRLFRVVVVLWWELVGEMGIIFVFGGMAVGVAAC